MAAIRRPRVAPDAARERSFDRSSPSSSSQRRCSRQVVDRSIVGRHKQRSSGGWTAGAALRGPSPDRLPAGDRRMGTQSFESSVPGLAFPLVGGRAHQRSRRRGGLAFSNQSSLRLRWEMGQRSPSRCGAPFEWWPARSQFDAVGGQAVLYGTIEYFDFASDRRLVFDIPGRGPWHRKLEGETTVTPTRSTCERSQTHA